MMTRRQWVIMWVGPAIAVYMGGSGLACMSGAAFSPWHPWWLLTVCAAFVSIVGATWSDFAPSPKKPARETVTAEEQSILDELRLVTQ